ncbi:MAG TPA: class I SAM-dependent methyltransferase [Xanthobacteraceae bacterium]|nr:class I SAM-dependent methyltransferase [Xanthobacteraceae bacterium]
MAEYHKYVFDQAQRRLVGDFEGMYAAEDRERFDSWRSHDARHLRLRLALALVAEYNFDSVLEIGCGKGTAAQFFKRRNNRVVGIDISPTAIAKARASFPDIDFRCMDASDIGSLGARFDLVTLQAVLAYVPSWRELLETVAGMADRCLVAEYVPANPIGMVKSVGELVEVFAGLFEIEHKLLLDDEMAILFGRTRRPG